MSPPAVPTSLLSVAVFVDTAAFLARADAKDPHHRTAVETFKGLREAGYPRVVTRPTIWEAYTRVRYDLGYPEALEMLEFIERELQVIEIDLQDDAAARTFLALYSWAKLSFVDALNFAAMQRAGAKTAFTYDVNDYTMAGFEVVPGPF